MTKTPKIAKVDSDSPVGTCRFGVFEAMGRSLRVRRRYIDFGGVEWSDRTIRGTSASPFASIQEGIIHASVQ